MLRTSDASGRVSAHRPTAASRSPTDQFHGGSSENDPLPRIGRRCQLEPDSPPSAAPRSRPPYRQGRAPNSRTKNPSPFPATTPSTIRPSALTNIGIVRRDDTGVAQIIHTPRDFEGVNRRDIWHTAIFAHGTQQIVERRLVDRRRPKHQGMPSPPEKSRPSHCPPKSQDRRESWRESLPTKTTSCCSAINAGLCCKILSLRSIAWVSQYGLRGTSKT